MLANPSFHGRPLQFVPTVRNELCRPYPCPLQLHSRSYQFLASSLGDKRKRIRRRRSISRSFKTQFSVRASAEPQDLSVLAVGSAGVQASPFSVRIPVGDRHITVETGLIGRQASGAVTVTDGET
ncbi:polyribonucleotide nucleotidyltransferase 1, chloroplastic, partial [Nicotiana attenuata]